MNITVDFHPESNLTNTHHRKIACKAIRTLYKGFCIKPAPVKYSVSREKTPKPRDRTDLIIANYPLPKRPI